MRSLMAHVCRRMAVAAWMSYVSPHIHPSPKSPHARLAIRLVPHAHPVVVPTLTRHYLWHTGGPQAWVDLRLWPTSGLAAAKVLAASPTDLR